jgi:hypothetical protein
LVVSASVRVYSAIAPGVYGAKVKFGIEKVGAIYICPCPNMLVVVYYGIPKVRAKPSMVRLCKWFIGWADEFGIVAPPVDVPLVCRLV